MQYLKLLFRILNSLRLGTYFRRPIEHGQVVTTFCIKSMLDFVTSVAYLLSRKKKIEAQIFLLYLDINLKRIPEFLMHHCFDLDFHILLQGILLFGYLMVQLFYNHLELPCIHLLYQILNNNKQLLPHRTQKFFNHEPFQKWKISMLFVFHLHLTNLKVALACSLGLYFNFLHHLNPSQIQIPICPNIHFPFLYEFKKNSN